MRLDLLAPGDVYGDRINVTDIRVAKVLRFGSRRLNLGLDPYNLFNAKPATTYESVYDPATARWMQPTTVLNPRATRLNAQFDSDTRSETHRLQRRTDQAKRGVR
jgi:hypothetical protein